MKAPGRFTLALAILGGLNPCLFAQSDWQTTNAPHNAGSEQLSWNGAAGVGDVAINRPQATSDAKGELFPATHTQAPSFEKAAPGPALPPAPGLPQNKGMPAVPGAGEVGPNPAPLAPPFVGGAPPFMIFNPGMGPDYPAPAPVAPPPSDCPAPSKISVGFFADFLFLKARGADLIFAQPRDGSTILSSPIGPQGTLQPDYSAGFRAGMLYCISDCSIIETSFLWWENQTKEFITAPTNPVGAVIHSTLILPSILNPPADGISAKASQGLEQRLGDVDYKHVLCSNPGHYTLNWLAGARYAYLRQNMHSEFAVLGTTTVDTNVTFEGAGPMTGLDGEVCCAHGIRLYGRTTGSLIAGHLGASYNQFNVFAGNQGNTDYRHDRVVPMAEFELGVGWVSPKGHWRVTAGYYMGAWIDIVTTPDFINAVQANNFTTNGKNLQSDITFDGLTFRLEFRF